MSWASTTALAVAVRTGMRGERGGSARQCSAVALQTQATDLPHQSSAARRGARQGIGNWRVRFELDGVFLLVAVGRIKRIERAKWAH